MTTAGVAAIVLAMTVSGCGGGTVSQQQSAVDAATKAIYAGDVDAMQAQFDPALQKQVTLGNLTALSGRLHAFGAFKGLTQTAADSTSGRYDYNAAFDSATLAVHVRLDPNGRIAAYRIDVPAQTASTAK